MVVREEPTGEEEEREAGEADLGEYQMMAFSDIKVVVFYSG